MVLRELLIRLGLSGGEETGRGLDGVDKKVNNLTDSFRGLGGVITGVFAGLSIKSIIDTADHMQSLEFRLGQMQTSASGGADAFDNLANHAQTARVSIESYAEAYTGIGAATHELIHTQEDLLNVTDSVAMGLQLAGANTQQTTSVMQQLTQAVAVGKLQWEDMRVIMQNSDAFASRLAKSLGMTLNQMVKATQGQGGGIGADKIINALRNMSGQVRKEFSSMPMTVGQAMQTIGARWDAFIARMNRSTHTVSQIANWFLWLADKVEYAMDVCIDALGGAESAVKFLTVAIGAAGLLGAIWLLPAAFAAITSPITLVIGSMILLYGVIEDLYRWSEGKSSLFEKWVGPVTDYRLQIDQLKESLSELRDMAKSVIYMWRDLDKSFRDSSLTKMFIKSQDYTRDLGERFRGWAFGGDSEQDQSQGEGKGAFDWLARKARDYNQESQRQMDFVSNPRYSQLSLATPSQSNFSVTIGNITVPSGTSNEQVQFLEDSATKAYSQLGFKATSLGENLSINGGVNR